MENNKDLDKDKQPVPHVPNMEDNEGKKTTVTLFGPRRRLSCLDWLFFL